MALEDVTRKTSSTNGHSKGSTSGKLRTAPTATKCQRCGRNKHDSLDKCRARNVICHRCKMGHFKAHCQSKVAASTSEVQTDDLAFLGALAAKGNFTWRSIVNLDRSNVNFKLHTGAEVTTLTDNMYKQLYSRRRLQQNITSHHITSHHIT